MKKVLLGGVLVGGIMSGNCSDASVESEILSPSSHTMKVITGETFRGLDTTSQDHFIESFISIISDSDTMRIILDRISVSKLVFSSRVDIQKLPCNIALLYTKLQDRSTSVGAEMKEAGDSSTLDSVTIAAICSTCDSVKSVVESSDAAFTSETFDTQEKKRLAISLLRQLRTQVHPSMKDRLTGLIDSVGITDYPETENEFNKSLSALGNCTSGSQYNKYFTFAHLKDYTILLNFLATVETIIRRKPTMSVSINNVVGHLWSCIEDVTAREGYDSTLLVKFEELAAKYTEDE